MSINCTFHRAKAAHFQCHECGSAFCEDCISLRETQSHLGREKNYFCPGCNLPAEMLGIGNIIEPFWQRLPAFFLYPFQLTPLLMTLVLAGLGTYFTGSWQVQLIIWVMMTKYAYEVLARTAKGGFTAPRLSWELINQDIEIVFKQYCIFFLFGLASFQVARYTGVAGQIGFGVLVILAIPSILMLLVATNSVIHAMNPYYFIGIIVRIGLPYLLMYLFLFFLLSGPAALFAYLPPDLMPHKAYIFLGTFLKQFYVIIGYNLMGYVLLQYHREIGYHVDYEFFIKQRGGKKKTQKSAGDELQLGLAVLLKQGKYEEAARLMAPHMEKEDVDIGLSEKYLQLLKMAGKVEKSSRHSLNHLDLLVGHNKKQKALVHYASIVEEQAGVVRAQSLFTIAAWYREDKQYKAAIQCYLSFLKQFEKDPLKPAVYFELARLLHEQANNSSKAKQILQGVLRHYPEHEMVPRVREYLASVS